MQYLTESSVVSMLPFGRSPTSVVSLKLIFTLLAAVDVAAPLCGFVASSKTFKEAIACNCVAFSSTFPTKKRQRKSDNENVGEITFELIFIVVVYSVVGVRNTASSTFYVSRGNSLTVMHWINGVNHQL